jgi:hypothetical protein
MKYEELEVLADEVLEKLLDDSWDTIRMIKTIKEVRKYKEEKDHDARS